MFCLSDSNFRAIFLIEFIPYFFCFQISQKATMVNKELFDAKIQALKSSSRNVRMFSEKKYFEIVEKLKKIDKPTHKITASDHTLKRRFQLLVVEKDGEQIECLVKPKNSKTVGKYKRYMTYEGLYKAIHAVHTEQTKHAGKE